MTRIQTPLFCNSCLVHAAIALAIAAALSACGGGGGSDSSGSSGTGASGTGSSGAGTGTGTTSTAPRWTAVATASAAPTAPTAALPAPPTVTVVPNDAAMSQALHLQTASASNQSANINAAWTLSTGATQNLVVAVIDSGVDATHPDLIGRVLPGYNFRADPARNNDTAPHGPTACSNGANWAPYHGTAVAGTIAANANNSLGAAGIHWGAKILPVRVNDGCTGSAVDLADAIRWAAGLAVAGAPANSTPAKVINISQGGSGNCPTFLKSAIDDAIASGSIVLASAGNSAGAVEFPGNCAGVLTVANAGTTAYGPEVEVSTASGVYTTYLNGTYGLFGGTSSATAVTSGVAALVLSVAPSLTADGMRKVLTESARAFVAFPSDTGVVGAGYLDAWRAIKYVQSMLLAQIGTAAVASNGSAMTLSSTSIATGTGASITSYSWSQASGPAATLTGATTANAGVVFPAGAGTYVFKLVVTDSLGRSSTAVQTVVVGG
jgi:serine protease